MSPESNTDSSLDKVVTGLPVTLLLEAIALNPQLWKLNTWRQDEAGGQQDTEAIMLRWAAENNFTSIRDSLSVQNTPQFNELGEVAWPLLSAAAQAVGATAIGRIFVVKLKPAGRVYPHVDVGLYADTFERFHICLQADPEFTYFVQHPTGPVQACTMQAGELWWFNHKRTHWAHNGSTRDRISIVFDVVAPQFRRERDILAIGVGYQAKETATRVSV